MKDLWKRPDDITIIRAKLLLDEVISLLYDHNIIDRKDNDGSDIQEMFDHIIGQMRDSHRNYFDIDDGVIVDKESDYVE